MGMRLSEAKDQFLTHCYEQGLLGRSIRNYEENIRRFMEYTGEEIDTAEINETLLQGYTKSLYKRKEKLSVATIGTYKRHVKVFIKWMEKKGHVKGHPSMEFLVPKQPKKVIHVHSEEEIRMIFDVVDGQEEWIRYRNCSMIALMLDSGLRREEVCKVDVADYNAHAYVLLVHGKGGKERMVPVGKITREYIKQYQALAPVVLKRALFISSRKGAERITTSALSSVVKQVNTALPFPVSSHRLRHNFATNFCLDAYMKKGNVDIYQLMLLLGHEDPDTTKRYLHMAQSVLISKSNISHLDSIYLNEEQ
ncbi:MAG: tyrosine-type recombinase/integrase [Eubacteriales bacterium]|nr:tyrosine-type recombinase/integrase [Eubacteriales bacterium]